MKSKTKLNITNALTWVVSLLAIVPVVTAQPYWMYWFANITGFGVQGGTRTVDFIVFFGLFTSLIYIGTKKMFGEDTGTKRAQIALSVFLGLALTLGILSSTQFSLMLFVPFAKNLIFFLFVFLVYAFLVKYGGMDKKKFWAFMLALILAFVIFNVANCFITEGGENNKCTSNKLLSGFGKPFEKASDWVSNTFSGLTGSKKKSEKERDKSDADFYINGEYEVPKDLNNTKKELEKKETCKSMLSKAKSPSLLCKIKEGYTEAKKYVCGGDAVNPYTQKAMLEVAKKLCTKEGDDKRVAEAQAQLDYFAALDLEKSGDLEGAKKAYEALAGSSLSTTKKAEASRRAKALDDQIFQEKYAAKFDAINVTRTAASESITAGNREGDYSKKITHYTKAKGYYLDALQKTQDIMTSP